jgi:hypothetical protein
MVLLARSDTAEDVEILMGSIYQPASSASATLTCSGTAGRLVSISSFW